MIKITREQLDAMGKWIIGARCRRLRKRLIAERIPINIGGSNTDRDISQLIEDAAEIGIIDDEQLYRLLRFPYLVAPILSAPLILSVIIRILHNLTWSAEKRLSFLEKHILPRIDGQNVRQPA